MKEYTAGTRTEVINLVACSVCHAEIGTTCQGRRGDRLQLHAERWRDAGGNLSLFRDRE